MWPELHAERELEPLLDAGSRDIEVINRADGITRDGHLFRVHSIKDAPGRLGQVIDSEHMDLHLRATV